MRPGEYRYAVAVRDEHGLWLVLWIHRTPPPKGPGTYLNHLVREHQEAILDQGRHGRFRGFRDRLRRCGINAALDKVSDDLLC